MKIRRGLQVNERQWNCKVWKKHKGYLGDYRCTTNFKIQKLTPVWETKVPQDLCGPGKEDDPRCAAPAAGFEHPHIVMVDDFLYSLHLDLL